MRIQTRLEEQLNALTHANGAMLGIAGLVLLIVLDTHKTDYSLFSVIVMESLSLSYLRHLHYTMLLSEKQESIILEL